MSILDFVSNDKCPICNHTLYCYLDVWNNTGFSTHLLLKQKVYPITFKMNAMDDASVQIYEDNSIHILGIKEYANVSWIRQSCTSSEHSFYAATKLLISNNSVKSYDIYENAYYNTYIITSRRGYSHWQTKTTITSNGIYGLRDVLEIQSYIPIHQLRLDNMIAFERKLEHLKLLV